MNNYHKEYNLKNKDKLARQKRAWYLKNKAQILKKSQDYYNEHSENIKAIRKTYYNLNKDKIVAQMKEYSGRNKEELQEYYRAYNLKNREKLNMQKKEWKQRNLEKMLQSDLNRIYGEGAYDWYVSKYNEQAGKCAICKVNAPLMGKGRLTLDHNHSKSGPDSWRGLLCQHCNKLIGFAQEDLNILQEAANYIKKGN